MRNTQRNSAAMSQQIVTLSEGARLLGVHKSTISRQVAAGIIPNRGEPGAPMIDVAEARAAREQELDRSKQRGAQAPLFRRAIGDDELGTEPVAPGALASSSSYQSARSRREETNAQLAEIALQERLGLLLDKSEVIDAFFALGASLREMMENARIELAAQFGAELGTALAERFRKMQVQIADEIERRFVKDKSTADAA